MRCVSLAAIDSGLDGYAGAYAERLFRWQDSAIEKIAERVRVDNGARVIETGIVPTGGLMELKADLFNLRTRIANFGRGEVAAELKRQR